MYSKISNSIRESILALRTYSGSSKLIISICLKTVSLYRGCKERAATFQRGVLLRDFRSEVGTYVFAGGVLRGSKGRGF